MMRKRGTRLKLIASVAFCAVFAIPPATIAAPLIPADFSNFDRPNYELAINTLKNITPFVSEVDDGVRGALNLPGSKIAQQFSKVLEAVAFFGAASSIVDISNSSGVAELARTASGVTSFESYTTALLATRGELNAVSNNIPLIRESDVAPPADIDNAVVISETANNEALKALSTLRSSVGTHTQTIADLREIADDAGKISEGAVRLRGASEEVAQVIADAFLGGILYAELQSLIGNVVVLDDLARTANDVEATANALIAKNLANVQVLNAAAQAYNTALARPMALTDYEFTSSFPGSSPAACGYTTNFASNNFSARGAEAQPRFIVGIYSVTLTSLNAAYTDGCSGTIDVEATRTIRGLPDIGTDVQKSSTKVPYIYSVAFAGEENLYLLDKTVDFNGSVGESQPFLLVGSIKSPLEIIDVIGGDSQFAPTISTTSPELLASLGGVSVPEPASLSLLTGGLACIGLLGRTRRRIG